MVERDIRSPSPEGRGRGGDRRRRSSSAAVDPASDGSIGDGTPVVARSPKRIGRKRAAGRPQSALSVELARSLRQRATSRERKLWRQLRLLRAAGLHFRRQVPIGCFIADFACLKQRIVIELDGGQHSADPMVASDQVRDEELGHRGFRVLRFWNAEIDENLDGVVETILAAVQGEVWDGSKRVAVRGTASSAPVPTLTLPSGEGGY